MQNELNKTYSLASQELEKRDLVYIDLLGFRSFVATATPGGDKEKKIKIFINQLNTLFRNNGEILQNSPNSLSFRSTFSFFSDSIVASIPARMQSHIDAMNLQKNLPHFNSVSPNFGITSLFNIVRMIQYDSLMSMHLLTRGAISSGMAYHNNDENAVFGYALNQAVYLEEDIAITPRVIIDPGFMKELHQGHRNAYLKQDTDGYWFINFMSFCFTKPEPNILSEIKSIIENGLRSESKRHKQKWQWLAYQFNDELKSPRGSQKQIKEIAI